MAVDRENMSGTILKLSLRTLVNMILIFLLVEGCIMAYNFSYRVFADYPYMAASKDTKTVTISEGQTAKDVAVVLEELSIVESRYMFLARVYLGRYNNQIQAGTYTLGPGMTPEEICRTICGQQSEGDT